MTKFAVLFSKSETVACNVSSNDSAISDASVATSKDCSASCLVAVPSSWACAA